MSAFYRIDSTRFSFREYWWGSRSPAVLLAWLTKLLRIPVPCSSDDPNVESLQAFEVAEQSLPEEIRARFHPLVQELVGCGFRSPVFHALTDAYHSTTIYLATFCHSSGQALARIHHRLWTKPRPPRLHLFPMFLSAFTDGTFLWSTAGKPDMPVPRSIRVNRVLGARASALWAAHQEQLMKETMAKALVPVRYRAELLAVIEQHHAAVRDFHLRRRVFVAMTEAEQQSAAALTQAQAAETAGLPHALVLAELDRLQQKQPGWGNAILLFAVSLLVFLGAGSARWSWRVVLLLIPILFFHELGHYLAMRAFQYRNLRMFFIPFFGAAVSGKNYNVPGWKKAIVSLMGPVPGIVLGVLLGGAGLIVHNALLVQAAVMALILNGFNLLPILPLDGGWVLHSVLFSRHYLLDTAFRLLAAVALMAIGSFSQDRILMYLGIPMLVGLPATFRLARIVTQLRQRGLVPTSSDNQTIPIGTAQTIIGEVKSAFPKGTTNKGIAQYTLHVFETLNAQPPGWLASIALLFIHGASVVMALLFAGIFLLAQRGDLAGLVTRAATLPKQKFACGSVQTWRGADATNLVNPQNTIVATFRQPVEAQKTFHDLTNRLPDNAASEIFGLSVLVTLPMEDDAARKQWVDQLQRWTTNTFVSNTNYLAGFSLACVASNETVAQAIYDEANAYLSLPPAMHLVPPWTAQDEPTPDQRAQHLLARQTYTKLEQAKFRAYSDPAAAVVQKKMWRAQQLGDKAEVTRLREELDRQIDQARKRHLQEVGKGQHGNVDAKLAELYLALPAENGNTNWLNQAVEQLAPHMGRLPVQDGRLAPGADRYSALWGAVSRNGLILTFSWLSFERLFDGAPALADWLCAKGCLDFKYDFHSGVSAEESRGE